MAHAIVFDTESTGIKKKETDAKPEIIEAAWIVVDDNLNKLDTFYQQYKPSTPIQYGAMATHHIIEEDLIDCPPSNTFQIPETVEYMIGHNIDFDWEMAGRPDIKRICTLALAREVLPELDSHTQVALIYYFMEDKAKARDMVKNAHNALIDVENCLIVLQGIIKEYKKKFNVDIAQDMEQLYQASQKARIPSVMPFGKYRGQNFSDIPSSHLQWMVKQETMDTYVKQAAQNTLNSRASSPQAFTGRN